MTAVVCCILVSVVASTMTACSVSLYRYICRIEDESVCNGCDGRQRCFAYCTLYKNSNWISEYMLITYWKLKGRCQYIQKTSVETFIINILCNAILVGILFWSRGFDTTSVVFGVSITMLLALSIVDWSTQYIPVEYTLVILICGLIRLFADYSNWVDYVIGLFAVSGFLFLIDRISTPLLRKRYEDDEISQAIGGGDIKLMAATGLLLGWKLNFLALGIGCIAGSVIQLILMRIKESRKPFALGPYLSLGVYITMICGEQLISWYLNMLGVMPA